MSDPLQEKPSPEGQTPEPRTAETPSSEPPASEPPVSDPRLPRTFGAVLWFPLSLYARHPFALLAVTALPLLPGQALGAYLSLRQTDGARVVDGEVLAPPVRPGFGASSSLPASIELSPGWPADAVTLVGWVFGLAAGPLVAAALVLGRRLPVRAVVRAALRRLPLLLLWPVVLLVLLTVSMSTLGMGWAAVASLSLGPSPWALGTVLWPLTGLATLLALTPLLVGLPTALLRDLTLSEGIGAAWLLSRGRRIAHLLCLVPLTVLLLLPREVEGRVAEAVAGTGPSLGAALGVKALLVLFLAPLPVLLLTGQALWSRPVPGPVGQLSDSRWVTDRLDRLGATTAAPTRRPAAAAALAAVLVLVPLAGGAALWANPRGAPGVTTERLGESEFRQLAEDRLPAEHGQLPPAAEVTRSDGRPLVADRDEDVHLRDCRDSECSEWDTVSLGGGPVNSLHTTPGLAVDDQDRPRVAFVDGEIGMLTFLACDDPVCSTWETAELLASSDVSPTITVENPSGYAPVRVLSLDGEHPELLMGHLRVRCLDPLCGLSEERSGAV